MSPPSTVDKLPPEIRARIGALLDQRVSLDTIMDALKDLGGDAAEISRSALGRYSQKIAKVGERLRRSRDVSDALVRQIGEAPESKLTALNIELMQSIILDIAGGEDGEPVVLDAKDAMFLSQSLNSLAAARQKDTDYVLKLRRHIEAEQKAKLDRLEKSAGTGGKRGLDAATLRRVREEIYGIPPEPAA